MSTKLPQILRAVGVFVLVALLGFTGIYTAAWLWPLPSGQGLAYVAHPFLALIGCGAVTVGSLVACLVRPDRWLWWLAGGLLVSWGISAAIFMTA